LVNINIFKINAKNYEPAHLSNYLSVSRIHILAVVLAQISKWQWLNGSSYFGNDRIIYGADYLVGINIAS